MIKTREEAIRFAECLKRNYTVNFADMEVFCDMAIKALEQEQKIKVLNRDEAIKKLGTVDIYQASAWVTLLNDLEHLGLRLCEVKE